MLLGFTNDINIIEKYRRAVVEAFVGASKNWSHMYAINSSTMKYMTAGLIVTLLAKWCWVKKMCVYLETLATCDVTREIKKRLDELQIPRTFYDDRKQLQSRNLQKKKKRVVWDADPYG